MPGVPRPNIFNLHFFLINFGGFRTQKNSSFAQFQSDLSQLGRFQNDPIPRKLDFEKKKKKRRKPVFLSTSTHLTQIYLSSFSPGEDTVNF